MVVVIAMLANPQYLSALHPAAAGPSVPSPQMTTPALPVTSGTQVTVTSGQPTPTLRLPLPPPERIYYSTNPLEYPVVTIPSNLEIYGASDIPLRRAELVSFRYINETRGGITQTFTVPYSLWVINTTVTSEINPQYGNFRMALCYASNGTVIDGQEILNRGSAYRTVQVSGVPMYMIISASSIDWYRIDLQTPRQYYDQVTR